MKRLVGLLSLAITICAGAQENPVSPKDSSTYYQREMGRLRKAAMDSLFRSEEFQSLNNRYIASISKSDGYTAFALFTEVLAADFSKFNNSITASGFPAINGSVIRFGMGVSNKKNQTIVDFNIFVIGIAKKSKKGDEKITASVSNLMFLDIGYDLLKSTAINLYPYAGLSLRSSEMYYRKPVESNPSFTDISNLIQNNQSVYASYLKPGYQAGIGFDFLLNQQTSRYNPVGTMIFFKAGTNRVFGKEKYKTEGPDYYPGIRYGDWAIAVGVKFFGRK